MKNKFQIGDELVFMSPKGDIQLPLKSMTSLYGGEMIVAPGSGHQVWIPKPEGYSAEMGLIVRNTN